MRPCARGPSRRAQRHVFCVQCVRRTALPELGKEGTMRKDWIVGSVTLSAVLGGLMAAGPVRTASKNKRVEAFIPAAFALIVALVAGDAAWGMPVGPGPFPSGGPALLRAAGGIEATPDTSKRARGVTGASLGFPGGHPEESRGASVTDARARGADT